jgi:hypothetical protein
MSEFTIAPKVDETQEFIEIANDFANPLDLVREAISNAFDAKATEIRLAFNAENIAGEKVFVIKLGDNGSGMGRAELQSFFDLGNSTRCGDKETIGEKGHGTKVYFNAKKVVVDTQCDGKRFVATLDSPFARLHDRKIPTVSVVEIASETNATGTTITIYVYNSNRRDRFTHDRLRDHILWFTKFGSVEQQFGIARLADVKLHLKGLDRDDFETVPFGHHFPLESADVNSLFTQYTIQAPHYTRYFLENPRKAHRIEVFVLKDYLPQKLKIQFRPRTEIDVS